MKAVTYLAVLSLAVAVAGCSDWGAQNQNAQAPFNNGVRQSMSQPTTCSPADSTCGSGIGNPSIQSPVQKHEQNASPE